ncbi:hypothetical protein MSAN_00807000 [Mycena sanguinolenta]|uniref:LYC1 C-terminal domain-containing protein n=1 Tax=Mycena sanguinolenta TaxID=230812 RepID=A0A8H6YUM5_9AGAR|nr:hypothetical protein MSAN_00807000 [Mycena sanguinolenta]
MATDLSTLSLFPATPEQITVARRRTLHEWGKGLTMEEHLARDASQDQFDGSRDGRLTTWYAGREYGFHLRSLIWRFKGASAERGPADPGLQVRMRDVSLVVDPAKNKGAETVTCYGIASVFTPLENRGNGFASHMMRLLHWVIADESLLPSSKFPAAWGTPPLKVDGTRNGRFSGLWSDVGDFYSSCGPVHGKREGMGDQRYRNDHDAGVSKLWEEDAGKMRADMEKSEHPGISFAYLPIQGVASFQHRRLEIFLQRLPVPPQTWGVASTDRTAYATWTIDPRPPALRTLTVSRVRADPQNFRGLVGKILEVARKHDVKRIEMWNLPVKLEILAGTFGAATHSREEHLPAFKFYGEGPEAEISWAFNER